MSTICPSRPFYILYLFMFYFVFVDTICPSRPFYILSIFVFFIYQLLLKLPPFYILPSLHQRYKSRCISKAWTLFNQNCYCSSCLDPFTKSSYMIHYLLTSMACNWDTTQIFHQESKYFVEISQDLSRRYKR